jgi:hypothetical protein
MRKEDSALNWGVLDGRVISPDGSPLVDCSLRVLGIPPRPIPDIGRITNGTGYFYMSLPPGKYRVSVLPASRPGRQFTDVAEVVVEMRQKTTVEFVVQP